MDRVGLRVLKLAPAYQAPCKPSVQVKTWTSAALLGQSFFFLLAAAIQRHGSKVEILQQHIWFHQGHQSCARLSPLPYILLEMWLPHCMLLVNLPPSFCLYPHSLSVLLCEVTCESDQLNPDHQLCLTYFRFGTLGFLAFVYTGLAWTHKRTHEVWPARVRHDGSWMLLLNHFHQACVIFIHVTHGYQGFRYVSTLSSSAVHWIQTGNPPVSAPLL